jgi:hypothetical protein
MLSIIIISLAVQAASKPSLRGSKTLEESIPSRSLMLRGSSVYYTPLIDPVDNVAPFIDPVDDVAPFIDPIDIDWDIIISKSPDCYKHPKKNESASQPSQQPSYQPSRQLSMVQPSSQPLRQPLTKKNELASQPSQQPSHQPSSKPTTQPTQDLNATYLSTIVVPQKNSVDVPNKGDMKPNTVDQVTNHGGDILSGIFTIHCIWYGDWTHEDREVTQYLHKIICCV